MARYDKFIPELWSASIQRNLEKLHVFAEDCNRQYEGDVKGPGDTVHILGAAKPTITTITRANANNELPVPEELDGTEQLLTINQMSYFNYMVGDIDKAQSVDTLMDSLTQETAEGMADAMDKYISSKVMDATKLNSAAQQVTAANILNMLDTAIQTLYEKNVKPTTELVITVSPRFYTLFKQAYIDKDTNNSAIMKNGKVGMYGNVTVKMSNNVHRTTGTATAFSATGEIDNIMIRTKRAVAFVNPFTHTEPYRPEKHFADAIKGYSVYDAKIIRPDEILNMNVKYTAS